VRPYLHRIFSFEQAPGGDKREGEKEQDAEKAAGLEAVILPDRGALSLSRQGGWKPVGSKLERYGHENGDWDRDAGRVGTGGGDNEAPGDQDITAAEAGLLREARSASSLYPSEMGDGGRYSPPLTVSPPLTFRRRILSSLGELRFSSTSNSSLRGDGGEDGDEDTSTAEGDNHEGLVDGAGIISGLGETPRGVADNGSNEVMSGVDGTEKRTVEIAFKGLSLAGGSEVASRKVDTGAHMDRVSRVAEQYSSSDQDGSESMNLSMQYNTRTPTRAVWPGTQNSPPRGGKGSLPRRTISRLLNRFGNWSLGSRTGRIQKWIGHKFRVSKAKSRAYMNKLARCRRHRKGKRRRQRERK